MRRTCLWLIAIVVLVVPAACDDKKGGGPPGLAPVTSATTSASTSTNTSGAVTASSSAPVTVLAPSAAANVVGACARLAADKIDRCNRLSNGDPTILSACREGIDAMVKGADDVKCLRAMTAETTPPSDDPDD